MTARRNPLERLNRLIERIVVGPFELLFPSRIELTELKRALVRAMEDNLELPGQGRQLAPTAYDVNLSIQDHQRFYPGEKSLVKDLQQHLITVARKRRYT